MNLNFYTLCVIYLVYSFLGWVGETVVATAKGRRFTNRGVASGPFCFVYGTAGVLITIGLNDQRTSLAALFFGSMIYATVVEWLTAKLLERIHHRRWWDYSDKKFNLDGYVCLQYSLLWGLLGMAAVRWGNDLLFRLCAHLPPLLFHAVVWVGMALAVLDQISAMVVVSRYANRHPRLEQLNRELGRGSERLRQKITASVEKRIQRAYPAAARPEPTTSAEKQLSLADLLWLFVIGAFLGDVVETIFCRITAGVWMSRSSLVWGPFSVVWGLALVLAAILSIPLSILLGLMCGSILNRAKGREMVTSYFIAYCMTGVYQLVVLYMMGPIIPILHNTLKLPRGFGIRNTVSLLQMRQSVDNALAVYVGGVKIPVLTLIIIALACLFIVWFRRTKLGQDMRAVGQDMNVARDAGINVDRTRLISIVMSTVFAGFGMIIYLQNVGNFPTYTAHTQIGMFSIAALLVGGASVEKASIGNVFLGVLLFHTMFIVAPAAGTKITGDSMIGEYFRVFVSYAVITVALVMYEAKKRKENRTLGQQLAIEQKAEEEGRTA